MNGKTYQAVLGELTFTTALHIGSGKGGVGADSLLRRNNRGEIIIPGTSLAGALRSLATRLAGYMTLAEGERQTCFALESPTPDMVEPGARLICGCPVCHLFGEIQPNENGEEDRGGRASRLWVYDATLARSVQTFVRDGVGIDRSTGAAARAGRVKFDQEILPAGSVFSIRLELEDTSETDQMLFAAVLAEWKAGRAWIGGGAGRGLGNAVLDKVRYLENPLAKSTDLIRFLKSKDPATSAVEIPGWLAKNTESARAHTHTNSRNWPFIEAEFEVAFEGLFLTQDATASGMLGFDHLSLMDGAPGVSDALKPLLPGSGLRGALRSHAERIARTLASQSAGKEENPARAFATTCPACNPLQDKSNLPLTRCSEANGLKSRVEPTDAQLCLACRLFGNSQRGSRLKVLDAPLVGEAVWKTVDFLAIDRFTGGGLEGAKFDAAALWRPKFKARIFLEEPEDWELGWLALLLRDLFEGYISFGFGSAKGFGQARGECLILRCGFLQAHDRGEMAVKNEVKDAPGFYRTASFSQRDWPDAKVAVAGWIKAFNSTLAGVKRREDKGFLAPLQADTYFGVVEDLYPLNGKENDHA